MTRSVSTPPSRIGSNRNVLGTDHARVAMSAQDRRIKIGTAGRSARVKKARTAMRVARVTSASHIADTVPMRAPALVAFDESIVPQIDVA